MWFAAAVFLLSTTVAVAVCVVVHADEWSVIFNLSEYDCKRMLPAVDAIEAIHIYSQSCVSADDSRRTPYQLLACGTHTYIHHTSDGFDGRKLKMSSWIMDNSIDFFFYWCNANTAWQATCSFAHELEPRWKDCALHHGRIPLKMQMKN